MIAHLDDAGSVTKSMTRHVISKDKMLPRGGDSTTTIGDSHSSMFRPKRNENEMDLQDSEPYKVEKEWHTMGPPALANLFRHTKRNGEMKNN